MKKMNLNLVIDMLLFLCLAIITGIGFLIKYVLITGQETWVKYGENIQLELLGMDRHKWGEIHLFFGFMMLFLIVLHILYHWQMIISMMKRLFGISGQTKVFLIGFISLCFLFIISPFFLTPERTSKEHHEGHHKFENNRHNQGRGRNNSHLEYKH